MRSKTWLFLLACIVFSPLSGQDFSAYLQRNYIGADGDTLLYRVLMPESYQQGKKYPLVLFLHGAGERGNDNESQLVHGSKLFLQPDLRKQYPAIVVFPQCPKDGYWARVERNAERQQWDFPFHETPGNAMGLVIQLLDELIRTEQVDTSRLYVGGLSMGGMGTFELLARQPQRFAAAIPICGGSNPLLAPLYAPHTPLWIFHGDADVVVPVALSRKMAEAARRAGGQVRYTEYPGVNHNSWDPAFAEPDLLKWLFSHKMKKAKKPRR
jgi:predicted peptidase